MTSLAPRVWRLVTSEDGSTVAELSLFIGFVMLAGVGFFCFTAGQFRDVFQSSYQLK